MNQIEETIKMNKTPIIVRSKRNVITKEDIFKMLTKEYREVDLRRYYLRLREKSYTADVTVINILTNFIRMTYLK